MSELDRTGTSLFIMNINPDRENWQERSMLKQISGNPQVFIQKNVGIPKVLAR